MNTVSFLLSMCAAFMATAENEQMQKAIHNKTTKPPEAQPLYEKTHSQTWYVLFWITEKS